MENKLVYNFSFIVLIILSYQHGYSQKPEFPMSINELNNLIDLVDTISMKSRNYHVWYQEQGCDSSEFVTNIWVNDKLGDRMYETAGINICLTYPYLEGYVFIYMRQDCTLEIPDKLLRDSENQMDDEQDSPFYTKQGIHQSILSKRINDEIYHYSLKLMNEDEIWRKTMEEFNDF